MTAYRNSDDYLNQRVEAQRRAHYGEVLNTPQRGRSIYVRRQSRIAFGVAGTLCGVLVWLFGIAGSALAPVALVAAWPIALIAGVVAKVLATRELHGQIWGQPYQDRLAELARLQATKPRTIEARLASQSEIESVAWPLVFVVLLGPLTLHALIALVAGGDLAGYEYWIRLSALFAGLSHLVALFAAWSFPVERKAWTSLGTALLPVLLAAVVGVACFGPIALYVAALVGCLVLFTGAAVVVLAFLPLGRTLDHERQQLALSH